MIGSFPSNWSIAPWQVYRKQSLRQILNFEPLPRVERQLLLELELAHVFYVVAS